MRLLVTGAAGAGTSTLGAAIAKRLGAPFIEADDIFWQPTSPPFLKKRSYEERQRLMRSMLANKSEAIVAGSVMGWGEAIENCFDAIVFVYVTTPIRLQRLHERELQRYGTVNADFLAWAAQYDDGTAPGRSLATHIAWLNERTVPVVRLDGPMRLTERLQILADAGLV